jgi:hypothetical protein
MKWQITDHSVQNMPQKIDIVDSGARRDFYGERLFTKISANPNYAGLAE